VATSTPKSGEGKSTPETHSAPEPAASGAWLRPPEDAGYYWRCFTCGCLLALSPADAVVAEARAIVGDITVVWCGDCIREAVRHFPLIGDC
jgi:hypothetical protein